MVKVKANLPRSQRSFFLTLVSTGVLPLLLFAPKFVGTYAGRSGYFYGTETPNGDYVLISKIPVKTRDAGRGVEAVHRFGRKASEFRPASKHSKAA